MKLLAVSGFIPEHICDVARFTQYTGERNVSHYCGYASDFISQVINDSSVDGAVFPKSCDSTRILSSYLSDSGKFIHQLHVPARRDSAAVDFFAASIKNYKSVVERYFQYSIHDIEERCRIINQRNRELRKLYENIETLSFADYLGSIHEMLNRPLSEQRVTDPLTRKKAGGNRVFLVGSFLSNLSIAKKIEDAGMSIVGDSLPESGRMISRAEVALTGDDIYHAIAESILSQKLSPTQNDFRDMIKKDVAEIQAKGAEAVIFVTQKYCEPYDYLFFVYKKILEEMDISALQIQLTSSEDERKAELLISSFADTL